MKYLDYAHFIDCLDFILKITAFVGLYQLYKFVPFHLPPIFPRNPKKYMYFIIIIIIIVII